MGLTRPEIVRTGARTRQPPVPLERNPIRLEIREPA